MELNLVLSNIKVYRISDLVDIVVDQEVTIEPVSEEEGVEVFASNDPALELSANGLQFKTISIGKSKLRFMQGSTIVKDLTVNVVAATGLEAKTIGAEFGQISNK